MKEVFISYSTLDSVSAETLRDILETNGISCWMAPRDIPGGSNYTKEIPIAIRGCTVFLLVLSQNAQNSHWVLKELDSAVNAGKVILPFMLEECILNDEFNFLLTGAQRYAAYQKKAEVLENLIRRIRGILDAPDAPVTLDPPDAPVTQNTPKPVKAAASTAAVGAVCPGCESTDLKALPMRVKRHGAEIVSMLLIPAAALVAFFIALIICSLALPYDSFSYLGWILFAALVGGGCLGNWFSRIIVRRARLRKRIHAVCYRCNRCRKVFLFQEPLND